jgi:hypothetical protein
MPRRVCFACVLVLMLGAPTAAADPPRKPDPVAELIAKLHAPIENPVEPNDTPTEEYLAKLAKAHGVRLVLDEVSFRHYGQQSPREVKLSFPAPKGARLRTVLQQTADWVAGGRGDSEMLNGLVVVHETHIEITTRYRLKDLIRTPEWEFLERERTIVVLVNVVADRPLAEVLREVADAHGLNVVLSPQAAKAAETRVTVKLLNAPHDSALTTLAGLAGLTVHTTDNVFLVTTQEHAKALKEQAPPRPEPPPLPAYPLGVGCCSFPFFGLPGGPLSPRSLDEKVTLSDQLAPLNRTLNGWAGAGFNIAIDPAVEKKAGAEVTAKLNGVSCEAAVKVLAELAGLRAVRLDNAMLVTTPEKADRLAPPPGKKGKKDKKKGG